jgi:hypothetical protein
MMQPYARDVATPYPPRAACGVSPRCTITNASSSAAMTHVVTP